MCGVNNNPIELSNWQITKQKLVYIHENPVKEGVVDEIWEYLYSCAKDYCNQKGLVELKLITGD